MEEPKVHFPGIPKNRRSVFQQAHLVRTHNYRTPTVLGHQGRTRLIATGRLGNFSWPQPLPQSRIGRQRFLGLRKSLQRAAFPSEPPEAFEAGRVRVQSDGGEIS